MHMMVMVEAGTAVRHVLTTSESLLIYNGGLAGGSDGASERITWSYIILFTQNSSPLPHLHHPEQQPMKNTQSS